MMYLRIIRIYHEEYDFGGCKAHPNTSSAWLEISPHLYRVDTVSDRRVFKRQF